MSLPTPLGGLAAPQLLRATTGAYPPQAPAGHALLLDPDGRVHGPTTLALAAGDAFAVEVSGALYAGAVAAAATLYLALPTLPALVSGQVLPEGLGGYPLGVVVRVAGRYTHGVTGAVPAELRILCADGSSAASVPLVLSVRRPLDLPSAVTRGIAAVLSFALTNADGSPYDLSGMQLVWTMGPLLLTAGGGGLVVDDAPGGRYTCTLRADQTRQLVAGLGPWLLTDSVTGRAVAQDSLQVL
jgi:hypothetical protein